MINLLILGWLYWDPPREFITIPFIDRPIMWYGVFFVLGFIFGYILVISMLKKHFLRSRTLLERDITSWPSLINTLKAGVEEKQGLVPLILEKLDKKNYAEIKQLSTEASPLLKEAILLALNQSLQDPELGLDRQQLEILFPQGIAKARDLSLFLADRLSWFIVAGTIIGARLGHVFFYDWPSYQNRLWDIFKVWEGGLASHGGAIGVLLGLYLYLFSIRKKFPEFSYIGFLDMFVIPAALCGFFIRIGNFFNQEILGDPTQVPWAVIFGHPLEGTIPTPRHPAQLYEAISYFLTFCLLYWLRKTRGDQLRRGFTTGLFFILVFGSRFLIEFIKTPQSLMIDESFLQMGQYLSLPFILLGFILLFWPKEKEQFLQNKT